MAKYKQVYGWKIYVINEEIGQWGGSSVEHLPSKHQAFSQTPALPINEYTNK
jgi:hypothetical protein